MAAIAVIDARLDHRVTVQRHVTANLTTPGWECLAPSPLANLGDYPAWLWEHDVAVLILDERLREVGGPAGIDYEGHELVEYLRQRLPTFPMFVVTSFENDAELD